MLYCLTIFFLFCCFSSNEGCQPSDQAQFSTYRRFCVKYSLEQFGYNSTVPKIADPDINLGFRKAVQYDLLRLFVMKGGTGPSVASTVQCFKSANLQNPTYGYIQPIVFIKGNFTADGLRRALYDYAQLPVPDPSWYKIRPDIIVEEVTLDNVNCCDVLP